jgi:hypothetical protein
MASPSSIKPSMTVVCLNDMPFAVVDEMEGNDWIRLRADERGVQHYIPLSWVRAVDDVVRIDRPSRQAMSQWATRPSFAAMRSARRVITQRDVPAQPSRKNHL